MTIKQKFERIDQSKLEPNQVNALKIVVEFTENFKTKDAEKIKVTNEKLDNIIEKLQVKNPDALKPLKTATAKKQSQTSKPKRTVLGLAKEIRKSDESFEDAKARATKIINEEKDATNKVVKSEMKSLLEFIKKHKELEGIHGTDLGRDASRVAKRGGVRTVTHSGSTTNQYGTFENHLGRKYSENRENRKDRLAPNYPQYAPLLENGAYLTDPAFGKFQNIVYKKGGMLTSRERYVLEVKGQTGLSVGAIEKYIDDNNLSEGELLNIVVGLGRKQLKAGDMVTAVVGKPKNAVSKEIIAFAKSDKAMKLELGGSVGAYDLAGHLGGNFNVGQNNGNLSGTTGTFYTGLVGETGTMSSGEMFELGGGVPSGLQGAVQTYTNAYANEGATAGMYAGGGVIDGALNKQVRALASKEDITMDEYGYDEYNKIMTQALVESLTDANFHSDAKNVVVKAEGKKTWTKNLYKSEYFNPTQKVMDFASSVARICDYDGDDIVNAYYFTAKMEGSKLATMIEDLFLSKKMGSTKSFKPSVEFTMGDVVWNKEQERYGVVMNNYGNSLNGDGGEIRLDSSGNTSIFELNKDYDPIGYNLVKYGSSEDKGDGDLKDIKDSAERLIASRVERKDKEYEDYYREVYKRVLDGEFDKKSSAKSKKYIPHYDIESVTVKKGKKQIIIKGSDVLNGANMLKKGGDLSKSATYFPKRDIVSVKLKNGEVVNPANGYWVGITPKMVRTQFEESAFEYAVGGEIENQYEGKTPEQIWNMFTQTQKAHFLHDHKDEIESTPRSLEILSGKAYKFLPAIVKKALKRHVETGQYEDGGFTNKDGIKVRSVAKPEKELTEKEWMEKHSESNEARAYASGGEIRVGDKVKVKASGIGEDYVIVEGFDSPKQVLTKNDNPNTYLAVRDNEGYAWEIYLKEVVEFPSNTYSEGGKVEHYDLDKEKLNKDAQWYAERIMSGKMSTTKESLLDDIEGYNKDLFLLEIGRIKPSKVIGTGYKGNTRKIANTWLLEQIYTKKKILELLEGKMNEGGKVTFAQKAKAIAKNFEGKQVEPKYQKEYGKTYDKAEAKEVGNKIAGAQKAKYDSKMKSGGKLTNHKGSPKMNEVVAIAKKIRKEGEAWASALKRAWAQVK